MSIANIPPAAREIMLVNSGALPLNVPGFGLPIDYEPAGNRYDNIDPPRFRHGISDFHGDRLTVREIAMLRFMEVITDKPDWNKKVFNEDIVKNWKSEAMAADKFMGEKAFDWCMTELHEQAGHFERDGFVRTLETASRCIKSDGTIAQFLRDELLNAVDPLLNVEEEKKDWHPNSNNQVLNLVHPSLYPLIYGRSRVLTTSQVGLLTCLRSCGKGEVTVQEQEVAQHRHGNYIRSQIGNTGLWSRKFQWLPAKVKFEGSSGTDVKFTSYINNLPPWQHPKLYNVIENLISRSIPLWNEVLIKEKGRASPRIRTYGAECEPTGPPEWTNDEEFGYGGKTTEAGLAKLKAYLALPDSPDYMPKEWMTDEDELPDNWEEDQDWSTWRAVDWKYKRLRNVVHPEPGVSYTYKQWKEGETAEGVVPPPAYGHQIDGPALDSYIIKLEEQFRSQGLQIIVKLSSIELTPERPNYEGGNWHLEGMRNEHIVATSIYYYDVNNVTESRLRFRQEAILDDLSLDYEQGDHDPLSTVFGTNSMCDEPAVQEIGSIATCQGRLLVFPNTLQHKVEPFKLMDPTKPGHRRFLVLWLVDPYYRIMSTANVPPQQPHWWFDEAMKTKWDKDLPAELTEMVVDYALDGELDLEEAKRLRLELMKERTEFGKTVESNFESYNLCEH